jgi:hypothetical protein
LIALAKSKCEPASNQMHGNLLSLESFQDDILRYLAGKVRITGNLLLSKAEVMNLNGKLKIDVVIYMCLETYSPTRKISSDEVESNFINPYLPILSTNAMQMHLFCHVMSISQWTHLSSHSSKAASPRSTFPTLQISRSSSTSSFDNPNPPCPPSASFLSLAVFPSLNATRLK